MLKDFSLKIVSPDGIIFENRDILSVEIPTKSGIITIYYDHQNIFSLIIPGVVEVETKTETFHIAVSSGIVLIDENKNVNLLVDTAEKSDEIDIQRALEAKRKAEDLSASSLEDEEFLKLEFSIKKELARIAAAKKTKHY